MLLGSTPLVTSKQEVVVAVIQDGPVRKKKQLSSSEQQNKNKKTKQNPTCLRGSNGCMYLQQQSGLKGGKGENCNLDRSPQPTTAAAHNTGCEWRVAESRMTCNLCPPTFSKVLWKKIFRCLECGGEMSEIIFFFLSFSPFIEHEKLAKITEEF